MKETFRHYSFNPEARGIIDMAVDVLERWQAKGFTLTTRQLYYKLFARFPDSWVDDVYNAKNGLDAGTKNTEKNYKKLTVIVSDARLAGLIDWEHIEDRLRTPKIPLEFDNLEERIQLAIDNYALRRWSDQPKYVEVWTEKDALSQIIGIVAKRWHLPTIVNRGYSSQSAMYDASQRYLTKCEAEAEVPEIADAIEQLHAAQFTGKGLAHAKEELEYVTDTYPREYAKKPVLLYIGDHDPSGEDMVRDIRERMEMFGVRGIEVVKVALTIGQVRQYKLDPDPAKVTDPRATEYIKLHGKRSWELDALDPDLLQRMMETEIRKHVDVAKYNRWLETEETDKVFLTNSLEERRVQEAKRVARNAKALFGPVPKELLKKFNLKAKKRKAKR